VQLYLNGKIREWYSRSDGRGAASWWMPGIVAGAQAMMESASVSQGPSHGPRVHRRRTAFAAPIADGETLTGRRH